MDPLTLLQLGGGILSGLGGLFGGGKTPEYKLPPEAQQLMTQLMGQYGQGYRPTEIEQALQQSIMGRLNGNYQGIPDEVYNQMKGQVQTDLYSQLQDYNKRLSEDAARRGVVSSGILTENYNKAHGDYMDSLGRAYTDLAVQRDNARRQGLSEAYGYAGQLGQNDYNRWANQFNMGNNLYNSMTGQAQNQYASDINKYNAQNQNSQNMMGTAGYLFSNVDWSNPWGKKTGSNYYYNGVGR